MGMSENRWQKENFVFRLKSPLHIGYIGYIPFKGPVVSPTRYYVPGRNFWGAVTKRITEHLCKVPEADDYKKIGKQVMENFRFSYFYLYDGKTIYLPHYTDKGMKYGNITKAEFEHRFIGCIVSTGIEDETRTVKDKSLHEIEFINNRFRDENGDIKPVMIAGCIWIKKNTKIEVKRNKEEKEETYLFKIEPIGIFIDNFNIFSELILGGESKYGFGHILLDSINRVEFSNLAPFKWGDIPEKIEIKQEEPLVAHLKYNRNMKFEGDIELLTGRGYVDPKKLENNDNTEASDKIGEILSKLQYYFSPGTVLTTNNSNLILSWDGTLSSK